MKARLYPVPTIINKHADLRWIMVRSFRRFVAELVTVFGQGGLDGRSIVVSKQIGNAVSYNKTISILIWLLEQVDRRCSVDLLRDIFVARVDFVGSLEQGAFQLRTTPGREKSDGCRQTESAGYHEHQKAAADEQAGELAVSHKHDRQRLNRNRPNNPHTSHQPAFQWFSECRQADERYSA